jgi:hypothetical protein
MGVSILGMDGNPWGPRDLDASSNNKMTAYGLLAWTPGGSYVTGVGGDVLDLSAIAAQIPAPGVPDNITYEMNGGANSFSATFGYLYITRHPTNNKLHAVTLVSAGGTEQGNGTYASIKVGAATEFVPVIITWKKLISQP